MEDEQKVPGDPRRPIKTPPPAGPQERGFLFPNAKDIKGILMELMAEHEVDITIRFSKKGGV